MDNSTITGMGRGPGNLKTEEIIKSSKYYQSTKEFVKIKSYFIKLKNYINGDQINIIDMRQKKFIQLIFRNY